MAPAQSSRNMCIALCCALPLQTVRLITLAPKTCRRCLHYRRHPAGAPAHPARAVLPSPPVFIACSRRGCPHFRPRSQCAQRARDSNLIPLPASGRSVPPAAARALTLGPSKFRRRRRALRLHCQSREAKMRKVSRCARGKFVACLGPAPASTRPRVATGRSRFAVRALLHDVVKASGGACAHERRVRRCALSRQIDRLPHSRGFADAHRARSAAHPGHCCTLSMIAGACLPRFPRVRCGNAVHCVPLRGRCIAAPGTPLPAASTPEGRKHHRLDAQPRRYPRAPLLGCSERCMNFALTPTTLPRRSLATRHHANDLASSLSALTARRLTRVARRARGV